LMCNLAGYLAGWMRIIYNKVNFSTDMLWINGKNM